MVQLFRLCGLGLLRFDFFGSCFNELFNFLFAVFPYFLLFLQVFLNGVDEVVYVQHCFDYVAAGSCISSQLPVHVSVEG